VPTLFVTGLRGYLGREIAHAAPAAGWNVVGLAGSNQDIRDPEVVDHAFAVTAPDAVVHTAYRKDDRSVIVDGTANVARAAAACGARLVHLSTDLVFSGSLGRPLTEADPVDPITDYGAAKADAERAVLAAHPRAVLVRTSLIYGGAEPSPHEQLALDPSATFFTGELRCPVQVGDLAAALLELAARPDISGPLHVAGAGAVDRLEFAQLIARAHCRDPSALRSAPRPPDRPGDCRLDCSRAAALLAAMPRGVRDVLA
jgi:dTDP-4-dehydrorhamnose reductase